MGFEQYRNTSKWLKENAMDLYLRSEERQDISGEIYTKRDDYPLPWIAVPVQGSDRWRVLASNGKSVATLMTKENAKNIVESVNRRDGKHVSME